MGGDWHRLPCYSHWDQYQDCVLSNKEDVGTGVWGCSFVLDSCREEEMGELLLCGGLALDRIGRRMRMTKVHIPVDEWKVMVSEDWRVNGWNEVGEKLAIIANQ